LGRFRTPKSDKGDWGKRIRGKPHGLKKKTPEGKSKNPPK